MGLLLAIYRQSGAEPNGEISDTVDHITVVNVDGPIAPSNEAPAFILEAGGQRGDHPLLRPADVEPFKGQRGPMAGSNYAGSWDSRWHLAVEKITGGRASPLVSIHDRFEEGE